MAPSDGGTIISSSNHPTVIYLRLTDFKTSKKDTPLHAAARYGHTEIVEFILANVVDKNPVNEDGVTPFHAALP